VSLLTVKQVAKRYSVSQHRVLAWIRQGELKAHSVATKRSGSPRWRISESSLEAFEALRSADPPPPRVTKRHRNPDVIDFIE